jgi:signal transduction histidine kinase
LFGGFAQVKMTDNKKRLTAEDAEILQHVEDLELINRLNHAANRGGSLQEIAQLLSRETMKTFSGYGATLYLLSEDERCLVIQTPSLPQPALKAIEMLIGQEIPPIRILLQAGSVYQEILRNGKTKLTDDAETIKRLMAENAFDFPLLQVLIPGIFRILGIQSVISVPLISEGTAIGLMDISFKRPCTVAEVERLEVLAAQATVILRHTQMERALHQTNEKLARALRLKDAFLATMGHELRTPLIPIIGLAEALEMSETLTEKQLTSIGIIRASGQALLGLINDILDYAKSSAGVLELEIGPVEVESICHISLKSIQSAIQQKQLQVKVRRDPRVDTVNADGRRLKQMLGSLLSNAVKFTPVGGEIGLEIY